MDDQFQPADEITISDLATLKVITDPLRSSILELMMLAPVTVKQISERLGIPATKLYYHVNLLEKHGLIVVVDTQVVSGIIEKHYRAKAGSIRVDRSLLDFEREVGEGDFGLLNMMLDPVRDEIRRGLKSGLIQTTPDAPPHARVSMSRSRVFMTRQEADAFIERLDALIRELAAYNDEPSADKQVYTLLTGFYPTEHSGSLPTEE